MKKNFFTLIELLVVIAIIAILAAMLLPALNQAREKSKGTKCISNQKQLLTFVHLYAQDWDDFIPASDKPGMWACNETQWNNPAYTSRTFLQSYLYADGGKAGRYQVTRCPSFLPSSDDWYTNYAMNSRFTRYSTWSNAWTKIGRIRLSGSAALFVEQNRPVNDAGTMIQFNSTGMMSNWRYNHSGRMQVGFVDGHAARYELQLESSDKASLTSDGLAFWYGE